MKSEIFPLLSNLVPKQGAKQTTKYVMSTQKDQQ